MYKEFDTKYCFVYKIASLAQESNTRVFILTFFSHHMLGFQPFFWHLKFKSLNSVPLLLINWQYVIITNRLSITLTLSELHMVHTVWFCHIVISIILSNEWMFGPWGVCIPYIYNFIILGGSQSPALWLLHQWVSGSCCSEGMCYLRLQGFRVPVNVRNHYPVMQHYIPEDWNPQLHCC